MVTKSVCIPLLVLNFIADVQALYELLSALGTQIMDTFTLELGSKLSCSECLDTRSDGVVEKREVLQIPIATYSVGLREDIDNYFEPEELEVEMECPACNRKHKHAKQLHAIKWPHNLTIRLERFQYDSSGHYTRNPGIVDFPLRGLDLSKHGSSQLYDLVAVILHFGNTPTQGHYRTIMRQVSGTGESKWFLYDDDHNPQLVKECDVVTNEAYALQYQQRRPDQVVWTPLFDHDQCAFVVAGPTLKVNDTSAIS